MSAAHLPVRFEIRTYERRLRSMKRNPETGEMEEFHSHKLQDDLPEEEAEEAEIEIPVGDDY